MTATLERLTTSVRSRLAEEVRGYYEGLIEDLDRTPWYRDGERVRAGAVAIPARVLKQESRREEGPGDDRPHHRADGPSVSPATAALYEEPDRGRRRAEARWDDEWLRLRQAVVLGGPGAGKSFLTATTAVARASEGLELLGGRRVALDELPLPLHVELDRFARADLPADPEEALIALIQERHGRSPRLASWLRAGLRSARCWLVLDALDEVTAAPGARTRLAERLRRLEARGGQRRMVVTCRTANYDRARVPWGTLTEYELAPLVPGEVRQLVDRWFGAGDPRGEELRRLLGTNYALAHACRTPMLATLTCLAHGEEALTGTVRRVDLYASVLRGLARRAWGKDPLDPDDPRVDDLLRHLEGRAAGLFRLRPEGNVFTNAEVVEAFGAGARDELRRTGILVGAGLGPRGELQFSFLHRGFLEYLTACSLGEAANKSGWGAVSRDVDRWAWLPAWQEVVTLLAGRLADPIPLIEGLADGRRDDLFRHRLGLASLALAETSTALKARLTGLADRVTASAVGLWWEHQLAGTAEVLEHLGRAMPALVHVGGRVDGCRTLQRWLLFCSYDNDPGVRESAAVALGGLGSAAGPDVAGRLLEMTREPDPGVRWSAAEALGWLGAAAGPDAAERLLELARDPDPDVRWSAADALGWLGAAAGPDAAERLLELARDPDPRVRRSAARALGGLGTSAGPAVAGRLLELLRDPDRGVRESAAEALGGLGSAAGPDVAGRLLEMIRDPDWDVRRSAADVLGWLGPAAEGAAAARLLELLRDPDHGVRASAAKALGALGAAAGLDAAERLIELTRDPVRDVRSSAIKALGDLGTAAGPDAAARLLELLLEHLRDPDPGPFWPWDAVEALEALRQLGPAAGPDAAARLLEMARDPDPDMQATAAYALGGLGPAAGPDAAARLLEMTRDPVPHVRSSAVEALGRLGSAAGPDAAARLLEMARDPDPDMQATASVALAWLTAYAVPDAARLLERLRDPDRDKRERAARALAWMANGIRIFMSESGAAEVRTLEDLARSQA